MLRPKRIPMSKKITPNKKRVLTAQTHILKVKDAHPHSQNNAHASFSQSIKTHLLAAKRNAVFSRPITTRGITTNKKMLSGPIKTHGFAANQSQYYRGQSKHLVLRPMNANVLEANQNQCPHGNKNAPSPGQTSKQGNKLATKNARPSPS